MSWELWFLIDDFVFNLGDENPLVIEELARFAVEKKLQALEDKCRQIASKTDLRTSQELKDIRRARSPDVHILFDNVLCVALSASSRD